MKHFRKTPHDCWKVGNINHNSLNLVQWFFFRNGFCFSIVNDGYENGSLNNPERVSFRAKYFAFEINVCMWGGGGGGGGGGLQN